MAPAAWLAHAAAGDGIATGDLAGVALSHSAARPRRRAVDRPSASPRRSRAPFASAGELLTSEGFAVAWGASAIAGTRRDDLQALATARFIASLAATSIAGWRVARGCRRNARDPVVAAAACRAKRRSSSTATPTRPRGARGADGELVLAERMRRRQPADAA
jgi:hypothetical protein